MKDELVFLFATYAFLGFCIWCTSAHARTRTRTERDIHTHAGVKEDGKEAGE